MTKERRYRRDGKGIWEKRISKMYKMLFKKRRDFALHLEKQYCTDRAGCLFILCFSRHCQKLVNNVETTAIKLGIYELSVELQLKL
jgi:hypothetical protein